MYKRAKHHPYFSMTKSAKRTDSEYHVHSAVCSYLSYQYPVVRYRSGLEGEKLGKGQAQKVSKLQWGPGAPDLEIKWRTDTYSGLAIELKREPFTWYEEKGVVYNKNGSKKKDEHLQLQAGWLQYYREQGYYAVFCGGFDEAKITIDRYLAGSVITHWYGDSIL